MTQSELFRFLERTAWDEIYWERVKSRALQLKSDGCTGVPDWFLYSCEEHDIHYRTHKTILSDDLDRDQADYVLRRRVQQGSVFGWLSPISWIRWTGVRIAGNGAWNG